MSRTQRINFFVALALGTLIGFWATMVTTSLVTGKRPPTVQQ